MYPPTFNSTPRFGYLGVFFHYFLLLNSFAVQDRTYILRRTVVTLFILLFLMRFPIFIVKKIPQFHKYWLNKSTTGYILTKFPRTSTCVQDFLRFKDTLNFSRFIQYLGKVLTNSPEIFRNIKI